ncbi:MAG: hypothetical protein HYY80_04610, partial [Chloroflexi bacterium]|nr:hypothetical protein [Chloroflexota bacterium]
TFARNPDYWGHDPFFPENQLPYVDGFKLLIIPDLSTQMAALRTGKIDNLPSAGVDSPPIIDVETAQSLMKTNPELQWVRYLSNAQGGKINMRVDTKPFDDIQVRRALQLAVNQPEILELYWGGDGVLFNWPVYASLEYSPFYKPLEDYPESVRELYEYHPDKARQLLTEAGYPNGFKTSVVALNTHVDLLSVIKEYWAKIGVDLTIDVKSSTVHRTMLARKQHTEMIMADGVSGPGLVWTADIRKGGGQNYSILDEPWWEVAYYRMVETYFDPGTYGGFVPAIHEPLAPDQPTWAVYTNEQSWWINLPAPYLYTFWQPWLKNYYGAMMTYYGSSLGWTRYAWLDQELKKAMGH